MTKTQRFSLFLSSVFCFLLAFATNTHAAQLQGMSYALSDSRPSTSTNHTLIFTTSSTGTVKELRMQYCTTASAACAAGPAGLDISSAQKAGAGFTGVGDAAAAQYSLAVSGTNILKLQHVASGLSINNNTVVTVPMTTITNGTLSDCEAGNATSDTCYVRVFTCSSTTCTAGVDRIDEGITSYTVIQAITVSARIDPIFSFLIEAVNSGTVNNAITTSVTSTTSTLPFSNLTAQTPKYAAHALRVTTNTNSGYTVTMKLASQMTGVYAANNVDKFPGTWTSPVVWTEPTGTTPNVDTGWIGANTTDTDVNGWNSSPGGKFGPVDTASEGQVMRGTGPDNGATPIYVTYGIEANVFQPGDTYTGTLIYSALPVY